MILSIIIILIIMFIILKYPDLFHTGNDFISGRYIRLERYSGNDPITFSNFIIFDMNNNIIKPYEIAVNPSLAYGNGITLKARDSRNLDDIVLIETTGGASSKPYVEYDLGIPKKISKIIIFNRKKYSSRMQNTTLFIIDSDRNLIFEKKIDTVNDIYYIDIKE